MATKKFQVKPYLWHVKKGTETYNKLISFFEKWLKADEHFLSKCDEFGVKQAVYHCYNSSRVHFSKKFYGFVSENPMDEKLFKISKKLSNSVNATVWEFKSKKKHQLHFPFELDVDINDIRFFDLGFLLQPFFGFTKDDNGFIAKCHHEPSNKAPDDVEEITEDRALELGGSLDFCCRNGVEIGDIESLKKAIELSKSTLS